jgi:ribose transport system ATP-binding protein
MSQFTGRSRSETENGTSADYPQLRVEGVSKSYRHVVALDDVTMDVDHDVVGLVGENGAGKSTLMKILTGVIQPDEGSIYVEGEQVDLQNPRDAAAKGISLVHQEQEIIANLYGYENLYIGREDRFSRGGFLDREAMREAAADTVEQLGIPIDVEQKVRQYSFDERQMLEIARALDVSRTASNPVILLDEPTAALDESGRELLFDLIEELKGEATFVFISHELDEVLEVSEYIYVLKDGVLVDEFDVADATVDALQRSMVGRDLSEAYYRTADQVVSADLGDAALSLDDVAVGDELGPFSFDVHEGEIFGVVGVEGSGKERLGRLLAGDIDPDVGTVAVGGRSPPSHTVSKLVAAGVGYIPKERQSEGLLMFQPLRLNVSLASIREMFGRLPFFDPDGERSMAERAVSELDIRTPSIDALVRNLSGGNQQKVVLGRWLARDADVLVMDNVTRGIDVGAKEEVYRLCRELASDGRAIVFIGDELPEVIGMSNRIGVLRNGELVDVVAAEPGEKPTEEDLIQRMV